MKPRHAAVRIDRPVPSLPERLMSQLPRDSFETSHPFESARVGAAAVYCSDGRYGEHFDDFFHRGLGLPRYDRLAIPGGAACLAGHFATYREEEGVLEQLRFLVRVHSIERVVLVAHQDCAFYTQWLKVSPLSLQEQQRIDLIQAAARVERLQRGLRVDAWFARRDHDRIRFMPIDRGLGRPSDFELSDY
jgi:hypothetical protein